MDWTGLTLILVAWHAVGFVVHTELDHRFPGEAFTTQQVLVSVALWPVVLSLAFIATRRQRGQ